MKESLLYLLVLASCGDNIRPATGVPDAGCPVVTVAVDATIPDATPDAPAPSCGTCTEDTMPPLVKEWLATGAPQPANSDVTTLLEVWAANNCVPP